MDVLKYSKDLREMGYSISEIRFGLHSKGYPDEKIDLAISMIKSDDEFLLYAYESDYVHFKKALGFAFLLLLGLSGAYGSIYFSTNLYTIVVNGGGVAKMSKVSLAAMACIFAALTQILPNITELKELYQEYQKVKKLRWTIKYKDLEC